MLRPELEPLPARMMKLKVCRGWPVPWFVPWVNGVPEFHFASKEARQVALKQRLCWVCGETFGVAHPRGPSLYTFVVGPMCGVNRVTAEPPCHKLCARWSARNCPFLSKPWMERRDQNIGINPGGFMIERNPGVTLLWTTATWHVLPDSNGGSLISMGHPNNVEWYKLGRLATRAEVEQGIAEGLPILEKVAAEEDGDKFGGLAKPYSARADLRAALGRLRALMPTGGA